MQAKIKSWLARFWKNSLAKSVKRHLLKVLLTDEEKFFFSLLAPNDAVGTQAGEGYLSRWGWKKSRSTAFPLLNSSGQPIPWFTFSAVGFLEERLSPGLSVLEFGAGSSTLFFLRLGCRVWALEHDPHFRESLRQHSSGDLVLLTIDYDDLTPANLPPGPFSIIVIDGLERTSSTLIAVSLLAEKTGVLILDDSERPEYESAKALLRQRGYREMPFYGLRSFAAAETCTSLFYQPGNCLGI